MRRKNLQVDRYALQYGTLHQERAKDHTLERYRQARVDGYQPAGPMKADMDRFDKDIAAGTAERA